MDEWSADPEGVWARWETAAINNNKTGFQQTRIPTRATRSIRASRKLDKNNFGAEHKRTIRWNFQNKLTALQFADIAAGTEYFEINLSTNYDALYHGRRFILDRQYPALAGAGADVARDGRHDWRAAGDPSSVRVRLKREATGSSQCHDSFDSQGTGGGRQSAAPVSVCACTVAQSESGWRGAASKRKNRTRCVPADWDQPQVQLRVLTGSGRERCATPEYLTGAPIYSGVSRR